MPGIPQMGLEDQIDDNKALELLCGNDDERQRACYYYYEKYSEKITNCVRAKFPSLPSDLLSDAVTSGFTVFFEKAASDRAFDPDRPDRYILRVALNGACDTFRSLTGRGKFKGKFKEECIEDIAAALDGTQVARDWSSAVRKGDGREIQELFRQELAHCGTRQRQIGRLMVDHLDGTISDIELAELYRETYGEPITVPSAKRAREEVRKKLTDVLNQSTRQNR